MGYKVLFWRGNWWGYPKAHQGNNSMVSPKPSGVIGEGSGAGKDGGKGEDGRSCANLELTHPSNPHYFSGYLV